LPSKRDPNPGDWQSLEYLGESVIVIRGDDGEVRAFSNVCRTAGRGWSTACRLRQVLTAPISVELRRDGGWSACRIAPNIWLRTRITAVSGRARELARVPVHHARTWKSVGCRNDGAL